MSADPAAPPPEVLKEPTPAVVVLYCDVCKFPPEYCEFGASVTRCKEWLQETNADLFERYWSDEALASRIGTLSLEKQKALEKDAAKKEAKSEAKADAALKKRAESMVTLRRVQRNKNKFVTTIFGLEAFDVDLKKASKLFATKFACGASVTKDPQGRDEIVVQGDVAYDIEELLTAPKGKDAPILKGVPEDNIEIVEEKKKKGGS